MLVIRQRSVVYGCMYVFLLKNRTSDLCCAVYNYTQPCHCHMKRGFLLHDRNKHNITVPQRDASTTPPSPEFAMAAETVTMIHASTFALFAGEPSVLWLCRHQESRTADQHFQEETRKRQQKTMDYCMIYMTKTPTMPKVLRRCTSCNQNRSDRFYPGRRCTTCGVCAIFQQRLIQILLATSD